MKKLLFSAAMLSMALFSCQSDDSVIDGPSGINAPVAVSNIAANFGDGKMVVTTTGKLLAKAKSRADDTGVTMPGEPGIPSEAVELSTAVSKGTVSNQNVFKVTDIYELSYAYFPANSTIYVSGNLTATNFGGDGWPNLPKIIVLSGGELNTKINIANIDNYGTVNFVHGGTTGVTYFVLPENVTIRSKKIISYPDMEIRVHGTIYSEVGLEFGTFTGNNGTILTPGTIKVSTDGHKGTLKCDKYYSTNTSWNGGDYTIGCASVISEKFEINGGNAQVHMGSSCHIKAHDAIFAGTGGACNVIMEDKAFLEIENNMQIKNAGDVKFTGPTADGEIAIIKTTTLASNFEDFSETILNNIGVDFEAWDYNNSTGLIDSNTGLVRLKTTAQESTIPASSCSPGYNVKEKAETTDYVVKYLYEDGTTAAPQKTVTGAEVGTTVTEEAVTVPGATPDASEKSLLLAKEGNEIVFVYTKNAPVVTNVPYTVYYKDKATGNELQDATNGSVEEGTTSVSLTAPAELTKDGKTYVAENTTYTLTIAADGTNEYTFWYNEKEEGTPTPSTPTVDGCDFQYTIPVEIEGEWALNADDFAIHTPYFDENIAKAPNGHESIGKENGAAYVKVEQGEQVVVKLQDVCDMYNSYVGKTNADGFPYLDASGNLNLTVYLWPQRMGVHEKDGVTPTFLTVEPADFKDVNGNTVDFTDPANPKGIYIIGGYDPTAVGEKYTYDYKSNGTYEVRTQAYMGYVGTGKGKSAYIKVSFIVSKK